MCLLPLNDLPYNGRMKLHDTDIAIIGGGMVGAACAIALKTLGHRIALVDASATLAEDHRLIALNYNSYVFFQRLGIWESLAAHAEPIREVHVSHRGHFGATRLSASDVDLTELGFVVPAKAINTALYEKLTQIELFRPEKLLALETKEDAISLQLQHHCLTTQLLIAADGTQSSVRNLLAIPTDTIDYQQAALVTVTELNRSHQNIAYERFTATGALAMLPLVGNRAATIWSDQEATVKQLLQLSDDDFLHALQKQFGYRLGKLQKVQQRYSYPLKFIHAKHYVKGNVILIGNAAHTVHPIAAQGLNLALYEIGGLVEHLTKHGLSLAHLPQRVRQQDLSLNLSHRLTQLFSLDFFLAHAARQTGMIGLDVCSGLKKKFIRSAIFA